MPRLLLFAALAGVGCATSLSATHTASTVPKGQVEASIHTGILVPAGVLATALSEGKEAVKSMAGQAGRDGTIEIPESAARSAMVAAAAIIAGPPAPVQEITVRYGVHDRVDVGLRYSGPAFRGESHVQLYRGPEWRVAAGVGVARHTFGGGLLDLLEKFDLANFKRTDVDLAVLAGIDGDLGAFYLGPKLVWSKYSSEGLLIDGDRVVVTGPSGEPLAQAPFQLGSSLLYGAVVGGRLGWKYVWVSAELGIYGSRYRPNILGTEVDLGGLVVYPTIGLAGRY